MHLVKNRYRVTVDFREKNGKRKWLAHIYTHAANESQAKRFADVRAEDMALQREDETGTRWTFVVIGVYRD